ncbi:MAG: XVIPCD domain-containing protein [Stenotrophomonas sp.]
MPRNGPVFQDHHAIEQRTLERSPLLNALSEAGHFNIHAPENRIFLPADPAFAETLGVTPHSGGPIGDYQIGLQRRLRRLELTPDGSGAIAGDPEAMARVSERVETLRDTVRVGLINGDLHTNAPLGMKADDIRPGVQNFFKNEVAYGQTYAAQLQNLKGYAPVEHGWAAVTHTEGRVVSTLQHIQTVPNALTRGGAVELQRHGLSQAISSAYHGGRLTMSPGGVAVVEQTLGEEAAQNLRVPRGQRGAVSMDLLLGEASARGLTRAGGLLTTGVDAVTTARTASALMEQGNTTAAQSEVNQAIARNVGGWAGGASTAMALGGSGFVPAAVVAADALLLSKAFERGADLLDNRAIYHQTDKAGVDWQFNGRNWERQAAIDRTPDGHTDPVQQSVVASYEKSQELGAMASAKAVELALGKAPPPQDPFKIPAQASDQRGLDNQDWRRNAESLLWERQVKTSVSGANDRGSYETQTATPERAQQLNQEALGRIESNIATGREAIAAAYLESHAAQRAQDHGVGLPAAVGAARANSDVVLGSDNQRYQRNEAGQWVSQVGLASGNLAVELELTNQMRQPSLERSQQALADIQALPAPTAAQAEKNELLHRYRSAGIDLNVNPDTQQAIGLAMQRTLESNGITGPTMQQLQPDGADKRGFDSPIIHFQTGPDGVARHVATTSSEELRQALNEVRAQRHEQAPIPDTPDLRIAALSPQEREAHQQALSEGNRQGLSTQEAQRVATLAAVHVHAPDRDETRAPQVTVDAARQRDATPAPDAVMMAAATAPAVASPPIAPERPEQTQSFIQRYAPRPQPEVPPAPAAVDDQPQQDRHVVQTTALHATPSTHHERDVQPAGAQNQDTSQEPAALRPREPVTAPSPKNGQPNAAQYPAIEDHQHRNQALPAQPTENVPAAPVVQAPAPPDQQATPAVAMTPMQAGHPDHALYQQIREHVTVLDAKHGRDFDATSERMTASLLVLAKDNGLDRMDHVLLSHATAGKDAAHYVFVVQGEPSNPAHQRGAMPTEQAATTSVEASMQQFEVVSQEQRLQAQRLEQQLTEAREQQGSQARGMSMG